MKPANPVRLRLLREALGLGREDLARIFKATPQAVRGWERGHHAPPAELAETLEALWSESEAWVEAMAQRVEALAAEQMARTCPVVVYMRESHYQGLAWPGDMPQFVTAQAHRAALWRLAQALKGRVDLVFIAFELVDYTEWLGGRHDSTELRAAWAGERYLEEVSANDEA